jgi:hypothetical protein
LDQPYRNAVVNFLSRQTFPADEPNPPYDDVAWTWPLLYGVEGEAVDDEAILGAAMEAVTAPPAPEGRVEGGAGEAFLLADRGQNALLRARRLLGDAQVDAAEEPFAADGVEYPAGSWVVMAPRSEVEEVAAATGLTFTATATVPRVPRHLVDLPRLGLVHTWTATQDAGWVRYTLDQEGLPYALVSPDDLRRGGLGERFDVLVFANTWGDFARMVHGIDPRWGPLAYTPTAEYPSHGVPDASPDITGGMGLEGLQELRRFVAGGGLLVTLGNAGTLAVDGGLVRRVERRPPSTVRSPGSELAARVVRPGHPIAYGYPERTSVFRGNGPLFGVPERERGRVVLQFGDELPEDEEEPDGEIESEAIEAETVAPPEAASAELQVVDLPPGEEDLGPAPATEAATPSDEGEEDRDLVLSGWVAPADALEGEPAILDLPAGEGRVVLFAFNPLHRYLNHSDFRLLFNVLLNWNDLP